MHIANAISGSKKVILTPTHLHIAVQLAEVKNNSFLFPYRHLNSRLILIIFIINTILENILNKVYFLIKVIFTIK